MNGNASLQHHDRALLVIAKRPASGHTKTRLSPPLSSEDASRLYECFLRDSLAIACQVPAVDRYVLFAPKEEEEYFRRLAPGFGLLLQVGASLGERLDNALTHCLSIRYRGYRQAVVMDSDSPTLPSTYVAEAFNALDVADVVLGPCEDGGYYLIGISQPRPRLLRGVRMSTPTVLDDTLAIAREEELRVKLLPTWYDVDTIADLEKLGSEFRLGSDGRDGVTRDFVDGLRERIRFLRQ